MAYVPFVMSPRVHDWGNTACDLIAKGQARSIETEGLRIYI